MKTVLLRKFTISSFFSNFVVLCSGLWMSSVLPLSPFYLVVIPIIFFPCYPNHVTSKITYTTQITYFISCCVFFYTLIQPVFTDSTFHNNIVLGFCYLFYFFCDFILCTVTSKKVYVDILRRYSLITILYMSFDFVKRLLEIDINNIPIWIKSTPIYYFYIFKGKGLHGDSNNSAMICLTVLALFYFYKVFLVEKGKKFSSIYIALIICLVLTFSRAALIAFFVLILFNHLFYYRGVYFRVFDLFFLFLCFGGILYFLSVDASGKTKIEIYQQTLYYIVNERDIVKILFGYGGNNSVHVLGMYAHNPFSIYLIEYGVLGVCLYILFFLFVYIDVGHFSLFILIPYFVAAISFSPLHTTYLFASLSLIKQARRIYQLRW